MKQDQINPELIPFLPLLYIAWADGTLLPSELEEIKRLLDEQDDLDKTVRAMVLKWLNPKSPPSASELIYWRELICNHSNLIKEKDKLNLFEIGKSMSTDQEGYFFNEKTKQFFENVEACFGIVTKEALNDLLHPERPDFSENEKYSKESFSAEQMSLILEHRFSGIKERVRTLMKDSSFAFDDHSREKKAYREEVLNWTKLLADQGFGALAFPEKYGGSGRISDYAAVFEEIAKYNLSLTVKFGVQFGLFGGSIFWLGTKQHHKKYLNDAGEAKLLGCFAMTEMHHGSNVRELKTTATYEPGNNVLIVNTPSEYDKKTYIGNAAAHATMATVFCQLIVQGKNYGVHAVLVPIRNEDGETCSGVTIEDNGFKLGLNGVDNGILHFNNVEVPVENLLNRFGSINSEGKYESPISSDSKRFFTMLGTLVGGRLCVPMAGLSASKKALAVAVHFALRRRQFGPSDQPEQLLMGYQTHQKRLMPLLANAYAYHFAHQFLISAFEASGENEDTQEIEALAAGMKALSTWNTTKTIQECREACGGKGYLSEMYFDELKADSDIFTTFEGDNTVLLQLTARARLGYFKNRFGRMGWFDTLKYISDISTTGLTELNPIVVRNTSDEHLLSDDFQLAAFKYRESYSLRTVAMRLSKRIKAGVNSYDAFIETQVHLVDLAKAYIESIVLEQFVRKIETIEDVSLKTALQLVKNVYALSTMEAYRAWYLEHEYISPKKSLALVKLNKKLCKEMSFMSADLVNAFNIPDYMIQKAVQF